MSAAKTSLGKGLFDFGVAVNKANARGVVVTKCSSSQYECILSPMMDYSGMFAMLAVNANNGSTIRVDYPAAALTAQTPVFASLLSHDGRFYYNHFGNYFMQFDATTLSFTFVAKTSQGTAMGMTVDDSGVIWSATYPKSGLVSFNPKNREFRDYGFVYNQTWYMYQRNIAADDLGYIYIAVGSALSQFVCFHPNTSQSWPLLAENQRISGSPWLYRDNDGKVYGLNVNSSPMFMFYGGIMTQLSSPHTRSYKFYISGTQYLFYGNFPSGRILKTFDPESKTFSIQQNPNNATSVITLSFSYSCQGATLMDMTVSPDGKFISGASQFPMNFFYMDEMGNFTTYLAWDQFNVVKSVPFDSRYMFFGSYSDGYLLQYDSSKPWVNTELGKNSSNPLLLATATPHIIRPSCVLVHPNNDLVLMSGGPGYGKTGGGLLIWSRKKYQATILNHTQLIENHATHSMVLHPNMTDVLIAGTTIAPGSGGQQLATLAQLYMLNLTSNQIMWKMAPLPGVAYYYELIVVPQTGYVYGITDNDIFFVFNPNIKQVIHNKTVAHACVSQGPHLFVPHVNGKEIYLTLSTGIFRIEPYNFTLTLVFTSKYAMCGGVIMKSGWFYFISNSHVYGFQLFNGTNVNPVPSLSVQPPKPSPIPSRSITPKASESLWKPQISSSVWNPTNNRTAVSLGVSIFERNIVGFCGVIVVLILMLCNLSINI